MITPKITNLGYSNLWSDMSTILGYSNATFEGLIVSLFSDNEQGFFYDPNDLSTLFQDSMGAVPVTAVGQPVGLMKDKSGRNNHAFQTVSASRPILQRNATTGAYYLTFDGVDDFLQTNSIDFTATDKVSLFTGVRKLLGALGTIVELSLTSELNDGSFFLWSDDNSQTDITGYLSLGRGSADVSIEQASCITIYPAPDIAVLSVKHDISGDLSSMRRNGVVGIDGLGDKGEGNFGNYPLFIGKRAYPERFCFSGHVYALIGVGKLTSDDEVINIEKELAKQVGVTIHV